MVHSKYLCTFNKIIGHTNKNKQEPHKKKKQKKETKTDKH